MRAVRVRAAEVDIDLPFGVIETRGYAVRVGFLMDPFEGRAGHLSAGDDEPAGMVVLIRHRLSGRAGRLQPPTLSNTASASKACWRHRTTQGRQLCIFLDGVLAIAHRSLLGGETGLSADVRHAVPRPDPGARIMPFFVGDQDIDRIVIGIDHPFRGIAPVYRLPIERQRLDLPRHRRRLRDRHAGSGRAGVKGLSLDVLAFNEVQRARRGHRGERELFFSAGNLQCLCAPLPLLSKPGARSSPKDQIRPAYRLGRSYRGKRMSRLAISMGAASERFPDQMGKLNQLIQSAADQIAAADRAHRQAQHDLLDSGDYVSIGSGWTYVGADRIGNIEAAVGAPLASFRLPLIHDPWGVKSAGVQTVYVPRNILARLGDQVLNAAYGTASAVFSDYMAISSNESSFTIYLDFLDTTNPVKVASYPTMPPNKRPESILVVADSRTADASPRPRAAPRATQHRPVACADIALTTDLSRSRNRPAARSSHNLI